MSLILDTVFNVTRIKPCSPLRALLFAPTEPSYGSKWSLLLLGAMVRNVNASKDAHHLIYNVTH